VVVVEVVDGIVVVDVALVVTVVDESIGAASSLKEQPTPRSNVTNRAVVVPAARIAHESSRECARGRVTCGRVHAAGCHAVGHNAVSKAAGEVHTDDSDL
jgi:hypothetical protein